MVWCRSFGALLFVGFLASPIPAKADHDKVPGTCEIKSQTSVEWKLALEEIHGEFLAPEVARLATQIRLKWIELAESNASRSDVVRAMRQIPVTDFSRAIRTLLRQCKTYLEWNRAYLDASSDPRAAGARLSLEAAYGEVEFIRNAVETRGFANYYEMRFLTELASQIGSYPERIQWNFRIRRPFQEEDDADGFADFFRAPISIASVAGIHLGFRALNDVAAALVGFVEIPDLVPGQVVSVDGAQFDFGYFIDHDIGHAREAFGVARLNLPRNEWAPFFIKALRQRAQTYKRVRQFLDGISERRLAVLSEGIWFSLDHEYNLAYRSREWPALPTAAYLFIYDPLDEILLRRFQDRADLGQAFKNASWIDQGLVTELVREFETLAARSFLPQRF